MKDNFIIRPRELSQELGVTKPTLWRWEKEGNLPPRKKIGPNCVGWLRNDIEEWLQSRPEASVTDVRTQGH